VVVVWAAVTATILRELRVPVVVVAVEITQALQAAQAAQVLLLYDTKTLQSQKKAHHVPFLLNN
jgi:hypothetical protein